MDKKELDKVMAFDTLFTNNHIQMLKILMSYLDRPTQKNLAIYIKYLELQYTISFFRHHSSISLEPSSSKKDFDISILCNEVLPYCSNGEKSRIENMRNMFQTFQNYKDMMEMVQMMKELFPEGESPFSGDFQASDLFSNLSGMTDSNGAAGGFDPSQMMQMFQMFQSMSDSPQNNNSGGDINGNEPKPPSMDDG